MERLSGVGGCRFAKANENPVPAGLFLAGKRLDVQTLQPCRDLGIDS
ncbi:MAG: hypothetical protein N838_02705 [Thiohalocapsa sp. PB-PSB1]|nr:MAG: hypothetical protein N838_02705 [Thiohalocapsa sp. PB-PSB1]